MRASASLSGFVVLGSFLTMYSPFWYFKGDLYSFVKYHRGVLVVFLNISTIISKGVTQDTKKASEEAYNVNLKKKKRGKKEKHGFYTNFSGPCQPPK